MDRYALQSSCGPLTTHYALGLLCKGGEREREREGVCVCVLMNFSFIRSFFHRFFFISFPHSTFFLSLSLSLPPLPPSLCLLPSTRPLTYTGQLHLSPIAASLHLRPLLDHLDEADRRKAAGEKKGKERRSGEGESERGIEIANKDFFFRGERML